MRNIMKASNISGLTIYDNDNTDNHNDEDGVADNDGDIMMSPDNVMMWCKKKDMILRSWYGDDDADDRHEADDQSSRRW